MMLLWKIKLGSWFLLDMVAMLLIANGFTRSKGSQMVLLIGTRLDWQPKDLSNDMV
jgi:hypothetical protein